MSEFPLWSELIRQTFSAQGAPKTEPAKLTESPTYALAAILHNKVVDQVWDITKSELPHAVEMLRKKTPQAVISIENKGGRVVAALKPGDKMSLNDASDKIHSDFKIRESRPLKVGDYVHAGLAVKGGAGFSGRVDKIDGNYVYVNVNKDRSIQFKNDPLQKWGDRIIKAPIKNVTIQEAEGDTKYQEYFRAQLKKHGYDSPADIPDDKKGDFFNAVDDGYNAKNEEMYPGPIKKDNPAPIGVTEGETLNPRSPILSAGARVRVPHKGRMVSGKVVRFDKGGYISGERAGAWPFYVIDIGEYESVKVPIDKVMKEEVDPNAADERDSDDQEMMSAQVDSLADKSAKLHDILSQLNLKDVPAWIQSKISNADKDVNAILDYMKYEEKHPVAEAVSDSQGMDRARAMAKAAAAAPFQQRLPTMKEPVVPLRMQAAMVVAKALGSVRGTGQLANFNVSSSSPEALVNQALRVWLSGSHTPEGWALGAKMLKLAKEMGIKWDEKLVRPATRKALGLDEAEEPMGVSGAEKLKQRQETEKETLALRHNKEKVSQAQRDGEEKIRKQAGANTQTNKGA